MELKIKGLTLAHNSQGRTLMQVLKDVAIRTSDSTLNENMQLKEIIRNSNLGNLNAHLAEAGFEILDSWVEEEQYVSMADGEPFFEWRHWRLVRQCNERVAFAVVERERSISIPDVLDKELRSIVPAQYKSILDHLKTM